MIDLTRALAVAGWMEEDELHWLAMMASAAQEIVEVGAWKARSTLALAEHTPGRVFVVDNWCDASETEDLRNAEMAERGPDVIEAEWHANVADHEDCGKVVLVKGHSPEMAPFVQLLTGGVDFAFIDADHAFEGCMNDLRAYRQVVRSGGILAGHDYTTAVHPGVRKAVDVSFGMDVCQGPRSIWWVVIR